MHPACAHLEGINMEPRTRPPTRCPYECGSTKFRKTPNGKFQCTGCGEVISPVEVRNVETFLATCEHCRKSFLWKKMYDRAETPGWCRACRAIHGAEKHEQAARKLRSEAVTLAASQARGVKRWTARQGK